MNIPSGLINNQKRYGFTIVELLIVIVVIGILAVITIVSYSGISQRARSATLESDLANASKQLKLFQAEYDNYPETISCSIADSTTNRCIKSSSGNTLSYTYNNSSSPKSFRLNAFRDSNGYFIDQNSSPKAIDTVVSLNCPSGYIVVPGSATYGTDDFCVMKYEAKNVSGIATSTASGTPWTSISQTSAITTASAACSGCELISEQQWLTIAQNIASVDSNWSGGSIGSGYIFSGHNDNVPANMLESSSDDSNNYYLTGDSPPSNQRRTLTLTNGAIIWDFSGNVWEWTSGQTTGNQPGITGESAYAWKDWDAVNASGNLTTNTSPSFNNPSAASWNATNNGIGRLYSNVNAVDTSGFRRGGSYGSQSVAGIYSLRFSYDPSTTSTSVGFRVTKP